jgi:hypothetical protein
LECRHRTADIGEAAGSVRNQGPADAFRRRRGREKLARRRQTSGLKCLRVRMAGALRQKGRRWRNMGDPLLDIDPEPHLDALA